MQIADIDTSKKRPAVQVGRDSISNDQLLYFTSPSMTANERHLVFISDRSGQPNLFAWDVLTGEERQLTDNTEGFLKSYIYFNGNPYSGLGKASVSLDVHHGIVYYIQGRQICSVTLDGKRRVLAEYPAGQMTAYSHVSADGRRLCVPTIDALALDADTRLSGRPDYNINERIRRENLSSWLRVYDTVSGEEVACERIPQAWVTHVQFSPVDPSIILYNNEWGSETGDEGTRRLWIWDGKAHRRLRTEGDGRSAGDYCTHEMWERDGSAIIYHGAYARRSPEFENLEQYVGRVNADGSGLVEIPLPRSWDRYGHYTVGNPGEIVTDGYYEEPGDRDPEDKSERWINGTACINGGAWISLLRVDWAKRHIQWVPLCQHGSSWTSQDSHPHPVFNHAADAILFNSDRNGKRTIYRVETPAE